MKKYIQEQDKQDITLDKLSAKEYKESIKVVRNNNTLSGMGKRGKDIEDRMLYESQCLEKLVRV